jgi:hypothetical protein
LRVALLQTIDLQEASKNRVISDIERRDARGLSYEDFISEYALVSKPVIITGLTNDIFPNGQWSLKQIEVGISTSKPVRV